MVESLLESEQFQKRLVISDCVILTNDILHCFATQGRLDAGINFLQNSQKVFVFAAVFFSQTNNTTSVNKSKPQIFMK